MPRLLIEKGPDRGKSLTLKVGDQAVERELTCPRLVDKQNDVQRNETPRDDRLDRLGRGGGYYDVTLKQAARAARVGAGYDLQLRPTLPRDPHDVPLDAIVTESRTLTFARSPA